MGALILAAVALIVWWLTRAGVLPFRVVTRREFLQKQIEILKSKAGTTAERLAYYQGLLNQSPDEVAIVKNIEVPSLNGYAYVFTTLADTSLTDLAGRRPSSLEALHQAVVAKDLAREREGVLRRLRRLGVHTVDAAPGGLSAALLNRYLDVKRRELVG